MELSEISGTEYKSLFNNHYHSFNSVDFNELNKHKCDKLVYLLFAENKFKLGLIAGIQDGVLSSPFSAPFGGFATNDKKSRFNYIYNAVTLLDDYAKQNRLKSIKFLLPPYFYAESILSNTFYSLKLNGYSEFTDINYHFYISDFKDYLSNTIKKSTRQNINKAVALGLEFKQVFEEKDKETAVRIIEINKKSKDRPMHLSFQDILDVSRIIPIDFFVVNMENTAIASAVVYHLSETVVQIVYWGDLPEYGIYRSMNFLSYKLFEFYNNQGVQIIDLATASLNCAPNFGLCNFKEIIGCTCGIKSQFQKDFIFC